MNMKLATEGVILSTDEQGKPQIQKIDEAELFAYEHDLEYVKQLKSDDEAIQIVRDLVIENYIESIEQDLGHGDKSLLYYLLSGEGIKPISDLSESELIKEAQELNIL